ncbi:2'-5' RNA ligase [Dethiosulfovibrio peptidovorans DSM 11002]|uniref:RNA 2',3'-cyclic phosphodiesterase n=1 Tax=Dethiosulfovibrio peptidovorans DSM 11002 TaxID=469381 RepID=D2Z520_9BACT|nr:RNA 2',3'-cyclic phosphodiesterase [Dethiosulfovibrio peptidovorans]EFC90579.1 2'-5' RNA ligase [Dethiosulfovibrio peptidovorans DSM 11002]
MTIVRSFLALPIPEKLRVLAEELIVQGRREFRSPRWVRGEHLHLTLRFFGELEEKAYRRLAKSLKTAFSDAPSVEGMALGEVGCFRRKGSISVIWMAVEERDRQITRLAELAEKTAVETGLSPERRPFRPHMTLARCHGRSEDIVAYDCVRERWSPTPFFPVEKALLLRSELTPTGPIYSVEGEYPLTTRRGGR